MFAVILAEFVVFGLVVRAVGLGTAVLISFAAAALGWFIVRRQVPKLTRDLRQNVPGFVGAAAPPSPSQSGRTADKALLSLAGLLLIVPGVVTGLLGLLLLLPPIRALVRVHARTRVAHLVPSGFGSPFVRTEVVDVDLFTEDTVPNDTATPPELG